MVSILVFLYWQPARRSNHDGRHAGDHPDPGCDRACVGFRRGKKIVSLLPIIVYLQLLHMVSTASARYSVPIIPHVLLFSVYATCMAMRVEEDDVPR